LRNSRNKWKRRASSASQVFSKLLYKIIMNNITKAIGKSFQILYSDINMSTQSTVTHIYHMAKPFVLKNYKIS